MAKNNSTVAGWETPSWIIRARLTAQERDGGRWLSEARSAVEGSADAHVRLIEVEHAPDLLLVAGLADWTEDFVRKFRRVGDLTPVIALNLTAENASNARVLDAGADDCLGYPFDPVELRARVQAVMRRLRKAYPQRTEIGADRRLLRIRVRAVEARVSPRQFEVFVCLAERREHWVHSDEIIATVSGTHHESTTSLVRVQVHALRKALGAERHCIRCDGHKHYMLTLEPPTMEEALPGSGPRARTR